MDLARLRKTIAPFLRLRKTTWDIEVYRGASPFTLREVSGTGTPILTAEDVTDVAAEFVADPFIVRDAGTWYLFFETLLSETKKGVLCLATSADGLSWSYERVILREPFHLSYPQVFAWNGAWYMIPETAEAKAVKLYRAARFPYEWTRVGDILTGLHRDPSVFRHNGLWWMFSETSHDRRGTLRLHHAHDLLGPWQEHPQSPVVDGNPHITRPGGRVLQFDGRTYRITQDTFPDYGMRLFAFEIKELTSTTYREAQVGDGPFMTGRKTGMLADRIHHMDACQLPDGSWYAVVDHSRRSWQIRFKF